MPSGRTLALAGALFIIGLLAFLTIRAAVTKGFSFLVIISAVILVLLGVGILGALASPRDE
jgi:NADH:ubiquinone oxidoreductase subunit K